MVAKALSAPNRSALMSSTTSRPENQRQTRWGIVLAGGDGARMRSLIGHWLGEDRPKQYCAFVGSRSMLQHTIDRARSVLSEEHVVTVIGRGHRKFLDESMNKSLNGLVLEQPRNLGTTPGVLLATAFVLADDPEATVILLPSDHFVHPESRFCDHVNRAFELAEKYGDMFILAAAIPDRAETEYGWIDPSAAQMNASRTLPHAPTKVIRFREKPGVNEAQRLLRQGSLWSTMVVAVKARTLWTLARQLLPEIAYRFDAFLVVLRAIREGRLGAQYEAAALMRLYEDLAPADFSKDILQRVPHLSMVLPMAGVDWCDWGHPQRVRETLVRLGRRPTSEPELDSAQTRTIAARERHIRYEHGPTSEAARRI